MINEFKIKNEHGWADNGVVGLIEGKNPEKKVVALRADIDALPILEANNVPYKSKNEGVMHACGHDVHTASLLGAARILNDIKSDFEGTIKLIFQPAEETGEGAKAMIEKRPISAWEIWANPILKRYCRSRLRKKHLIPTNPFSGGTASAA